MAKKNVVIKHNGKTTEIADDKVSAALVLASIAVDARPHFTKLKKLEIVDHKSYEIAAQKVKALKELAKIAEAKKEKIIGPLETAIQEIKDLFKPFLDQVEQAEANAKIDMVFYLDDLDKKKAKVVNDLEDGKIIKLSTATGRLDKLELKSESSSVRKIWELIEVDGNVTPREYMVPDKKRIAQALKEGKSVLGWKLQQKKSIAI